MFETLEMIAQTIDSVVAKQGHHHLSHQDRLRGSSWEWVRSHGEWLHLSVSRVRLQRFRSKIIVVFIPTFLESVLVPKYDLENEKVRKHIKTKKIWIWSTDMTFFSVQKSTFLLFLYLALIFVEMCMFLKLFFQKIVFDGGKSFSGAQLSYNLDSEMLLGVRKLIMIHRPQELTRCSCFALFFGSGIKIHSQDPLRKGCSTGFQICHFGRNFYQCRWKMENEKRLRVLRASRFLFSKARSMVK